MSKLWPEPTGTGTASSSSRPPGHQVRTKSLLGGFEIGGLESGEDAAVVLGLGRPHDDEIGGGEVAEREPAFRIRFATGAGRRESRGDRPGS